MTTVFPVLRSTGFLRVLRRVTIVTSGTGFVAASAVIALGLNARSLGAAEYGVLATIQAYVALIAAISTLESWQPVIRLGSRRHAKLGPILSSGILLDLLAAAAAAMIAVAGIWGAGGAVGVSHEHRVLATIYCLSLLAGLAGTPKGYFRLQGRFDILVGNQVAQGLAILAVSLVLWLLDAPLLGYVVCLATLGPLYNLSLLTRMIMHARKEGISLENPIRAGRARRHLPHFARMALGSGMLSTLVSARRHLAQLLVGALVGGAATGVYAIAMRLASMVNRLSGPLNQVLFPEVFRLSADAPARRLGALIRRATLTVAGLAMVFVTLGALASEQLVRFVAGPGYGGATAIFVILLAAECLELAGIHLNAFIQSRHGTKPLIVVAGASLASMVTLGAVLAGQLGARGIAAGVLVASVLMYLAMTVLAFRSLRRREPAADVD